MIDLRGRVAVVTGGSGGLGRVCARHLARAGMRIALVARSEERLEAVAAALREQERAVALPVPADLTRPEAAQAMAERVAAELGRPYLLVNAMNIDLRATAGPIERTSIEQYEAAMAGKPRAYYLAMRALLPAMLERGEGCIVNIASGAGVSGSPGFALFAASEFAIVGLSDSVARETQARGVHVAVLCPWGVIDSERVRRLFPERDPAGFMDPEDLADAILFLASRSPRAWVRQLVVRAPAAVE